MPLPLSTIRLLAILVGFAVSTCAANAQMQCMNELMPLRETVEKEGVATKAAIERKAERGQICNHLKRYVAAEAKYLKYLEDNQGWCGVPPDALTQIKTSHGQSMKVRNQACSAAPAAARQGPPPGPGLSDALGTSRAPTPSTSSTGRGTYDTLTGNPFQR